MLANGLVEEVRVLRQRFSLTASMPSMIADSGETRALPLASSISNGANSLVVLTISVLRLQQEVLRWESYSKNS